MGSYSSTLERGLGSVTDSLIPEPSVYKEENFAFVHYSEVQVEYQSFEEVLKNIPTLFTSEIIYFECHDKKELLVLSGLDPSSQALSDGIIVETFETSVLILMGSADIICRLMKKEDPTIVFSGLISEGNSNFTFDRAIKNLYGTVKTTHMDLKATIDGLFSITKTG